MVVEKEHGCSMAPEARHYGPSPCHYVCSILIALGVVTFSGRTSASSPQAPELSPGKLQSLPPACQNLGKSNQHLDDLLTVVSHHATTEAYNALGVLYSEGKKLSCAVPAFEEALRLDNQDWPARYNLALALIELGEEGKAANHLHILIQQKPDSPAIHNTLGTLLQKQGKFEAAAAEFKAALRIDPGFALAALNLGQVLMAQKLYTAAIVYLQDALKSSPLADLESQIQIMIAVAHAEIGNSDQAIKILEQVIKFHPDAADAYFNLATVYAKEGPALGYDKAIANFKQALRVDPHYEPARYSLAKALVQRAQFSEAVPYLTAYIHNQPHDAEGFHLLGAGYTGLGQPANAVQALEHAEQLKPGDYQIRYDLGLALAKMGRTNAALEQLATAEKINPNFADTHYQLALQLRKQGNATDSKQEMQEFQRLKNYKDEEITSGNLNNDGNRLLQEGKISEAAEAYRKAIQLDPNNPQWHYNLSLALSQLGDTKGEKAALEKALELDPHIATAHNDLGLLDLSERKMNEAEREFRAALEIDPRFAEAQNNLGVVYSQQGKDAEAGVLFRQSAENDPTYARARVNLGLVMAHQGDFSEAEQQLRLALKAVPDDVAALIALGEVEGKINHHQESVQAFQRVVALRPEMPEGHLNLGIALADQYDLRGALKEFSEAIRLAPDDPTAQFNEGRVLFDLGRPQEAISFLEMACKLQPNYPSAVYLLALILGDSPRATEMLKELVASDPENAYGQYLLGQNLLRAGKTQEAIEHWKTAVRLDPQNSSSLYGLARTLAKLNDPEATAYMDRFQVLHKTQQLSDRVETLNNFALEAANAHDWPQAVEQLEESIKTCGQCKQLPVLHRNLGLIYARKGDIQQSVRELEMALQIDPNDAQAQTTLQMLHNVLHSNP